ncbi:MAG TPA: hypothetical protein VK436_16390 [Methanocella sp.]|nr:hypothetical protein [Methanocella sp.]
MMYVKGHLLMMMMSFIKENYGGQGLNNWIQSLSPQAAEIYCGDINKNDWYPLKIALIAPAEKASTMFYKDDLRGAIEFGRYVARKENKKKFLLFPVRPSPTTKINRVCAMLQSYFDTAEVVMENMNGAGATVQVKNFSEIDGIAEIIIAGWLQQSLTEEDGRIAAIEIYVPSDSTVCVNYIVKWKAD